MQTSYPANPVKVSHDIFEKDKPPSGPPPGMPPRKGAPRSTGGMAFKRMGKDYTPVDGKTLWDTVEHLPDGTTLYTKGKLPCVFFCIHGAGHSGLSFTALAKEVEQFASVVSYDIRGHGYSKHQGGEDDLSIETLTNDSLDVLKQVAVKHPKSTFAILGHSLGGSIAVRLAKKIQSSPELQDLADRIAALISIDVIEGTAMDVLPYMVDVIKAKPTSFKSLEDAIKWAVQTKVVSNCESARASIPPQLIEIEDGEGKRFVWRNNLLKSQKYWHDWFKGLSSDFLCSKFPKVCFIAARERLDKELEIANMQGKFKLVSFPNVGHCMMEDDPVNTAFNLHQVLDRFKCALTTDDVEYIKKNGIPGFAPNLLPYKKASK